MPFNLKGDNYDTPLRFTHEEWREKINNFIKGYGLSLINPRKQSIIALIYDDEGIFVMFWTEDYTGTAMSKFIEHWNGAEDEIYWEYLLRNPNTELTM